MQTEFITMAKKNADPIWINEPPDPKGPEMEFGFDQLDLSPDTKQCRLCRGTGAEPVWSGVVGKPDYKPCTRCDGRGFVPLFGEPDTSEEW